MTATDKYDPENFTVEALQVRTSDLYDSLYGGSVARREGESLFAAGFETLADVQAADEDELLAVKYVGPCRAAYLKSRGLLEEIKYFLSNEAHNRDHPFEYDAATGRLVSAIRDEDGNLWRELDDGSEVPWVEGEVLGLVPNLVSKG